MRLRHLRVRNIRSYVSGGIDFADGTTLVIGDVGAGKTSLLYAIEMALFGTSEVDAAYLVRHGAGHAEVHVAFEDGSRRYEVGRKFRRIRRKGRETFEPEGISFSIDGARTEYSATELRQRVIELLGFPDNPSPQARSDLWRWAVYVPQERMRDILAARPQDRLETVRKALGLEQYRVAAENAQDLAADLRRSAVVRRAEAERLRHHDEEFATWSAEGDRRRAERVALADALRGREQELARAREREAAAEAEVAAGAADERERTSLATEEDADLDAERGRQAIRAARAREREVLREEIAGRSPGAGEVDRLRRAVAVREEGLERERAALDGTAEALRRFVAAQAELDVNARRVEEAEAQLARASAEEQRAQADLAEKLRTGPGREPPAPTPDDLPRIDERLEQARAMERERAAVYTRTELALHELDELLRAGACPRCGQTVRASEFEPHRLEAATAADAAAAARTAAVSERQRIDEERRARERYERARDRWLEVERERATARTALDRATERKSEAETALAAARDATEAARIRGGADRDAERREGEIRRRVAELTSERIVLLQQLERATADAEAVRIATGALSVLDAELERQDIADAAAQARRRTRRARLAELDRARVTAADARRRLEVERQHRAEIDRALDGERPALVRIDARIDEALRRVHEAELGRSERARRVAEATDLEAKAEWIGGPFRTTVLAMEARLLAHAQTVFERSLTRYFTALIDDPSFVARTDPTFTPSVAIDGEWTPAEALSGGERTSLALAFRLALAEVVRSLGHLQLDTILLDEPTDGFSPEQVVRMGELLDALALPQVVLVSHEAALAAIADRVIRVEKEGGRSILRPDDRVVGGSGESAPADGP